MHKINSYRTITFAKNNKETTNRVILFILTRLLLLLLLLLLFLLLLLPVALQPTVRFGLSNNVLPLFSYLPPTLSIFSLPALQDLY